ncbi:putative heavy metal-associated domain, HMA [Rosa chinensis]|uniref:Putative heavy metal-associated domain, HMA n=1 Tax=Rosa chinensis TaxID=74649 RepID=A0A2P6RMK8_ROSCH|nr:formin-like protein 5 [Rosa chinensis]PRQ47658.1 putative heavy metal-associated domain, HMA [Rosa chinensis]
MGEKKVTTMILKVDLQCEECYRKVKQVLCKFPQIRDQRYDEKKNLVIIKVVCCSPEKIRDKLCRKGGGVIKWIEIEEPPPPPPIEKPPPPPPIEKPPPPPPIEKPPPPPPIEKPPPPPPIEKPPPPPPIEKPPPPPPSPCRCRCRCGCGCRPVKPCCWDCYEGLPGGPCETFPRRPVKPCCSDCREGRPGGPCETYPRRPVKTCCTDCYEGRPGGPCETYRPRPVDTCCTDCEEGRPGGPCETGYGYGGLVPYIQYDGHYGRPVYDSYGGGRSSTTSYCVTRPDCFSEENPQACAIM